jgi:hypothetical protein
LWVAGIRRTIHKGRLVRASPGGLLMSLGARSWPDQKRRSSTASNNREGLRGAWRRHRRRLLWWSPVALGALAAAIGVPLAATYQPLQQGETGGGSFPGLPSATSMRWIYKYIPAAEAPELYVAPQRGPFALSGSVVNYGSFPVTILGVSQAPGSPFTAAGPVRYLTSAQWDLTSPRRQVLHDVTLAPGQAIIIGMPLRIAYCADRRMYAGDDMFLVTERFLGFTHTVPIPYVGYGRPVITNAPGGQRGAPGTFCGE